MSDPLSRSDESNAEDGAGEVDPNEFSNFGGSEEQDSQSLTSELPMAVPGLDDFPLRIAALTEAVRMAQDDSDHTVKQLSRGMYAMAAALSVPRLEQLASRLAANGHQTKETGLSVGTWTLFTPSVDDIYALAIAVVPASGPSQAGYLALLERSGRPDPVIDELLKSKRGDDYIPDHTPGHVFTTTVAAIDEAPRTREYRSAGSIDETIQRWSKDEYIPSELVSAYRLMRYRNPAYRPVDTEVRGVPEDCAAWFAVLREALLATDLIAEHEAYVREIAASPHESYGSTLGMMETMRVFGRDVALACGGFPGHPERRIIQGLFTTTVEARLNLRSFEESQRVRAMCLAHGFVNEVSGFEYNDGDCACFALTIGAWEGVAFHDQHRNFAIVWRPDTHAAGARAPLRPIAPVVEAAVFHWPQTEPHQGLALTPEILSRAAIGTQGLLGRFRMVEDRLVATEPVADTIDEIRGWNGFLFGTGSADCCLEEEITTMAPAVAPPPAPSKSTTHSARPRGR